MQAELRARRARMQEMGGPERVRKYMHERGKLDARQRLAALFDPGSFRELGALVGTVTNIPAEGFVCGVGRIEGRPVFAGAEACVSPVLSLAELAAQPHLRQRGSFVDVDGARHPAPAPRFSLTPSAIASPPVVRGAHAEAALADWGIEKR